MTLNQMSLLFVLSIIGVTLMLATIERGVLLRNLRQRVVESRRKRDTVLEQKRKAW